MFKNGFKRYFWLILLTINNKPKTWSNHQPLTKMFFILKVKLGCSRVWPISLNVEMNTLFLSIAASTVSTKERKLVLTECWLRQDLALIVTTRDWGWMILALARWSWCRGRHNNVHTLQLTHHPDCNKDTAEEHLGDPPHLKQHQVRKCKTDSRDSD